jgi:hypothetical protein
MELFEVSFNGSGMCGAKLVMDRVESKWLLLRTLARYHKCSYEQLRDLIGDTQCIERRGKSGVEYQLEIQVFWDDEADGDIRVMAAIDDMGWRAFFPIGYDFLASPLSAK